VRRPAPIPTLLGLVLLLAGAIALRLGIGRDLDGALTFGFEHLELRGARVGAGIIVGVCLAVSGVFLQSLLRNPLASPDILGLASGAGLGIMAAAYAGYLAGMGIAATAVAGFGSGTAAVVGSLGVLVTIYALSQRRGLIDPVSLVLVGVVASMMCSALTMLVRQLMPDQGMTVGRLLLGAVRDATIGELWVGAGVALAGVIAGVGCGRAMDAASLSEDEARSVGVNLSALRAVLFLGSGVLTAASVVLAGPVGFVGLICPHIVRMLAGPGHRVLVIGSALCGGALVVLCDAAVRMIDLGTGNLPIGVLTSLLGGPVMISLLRRERRGLA